VVLELSLLCFLVVVVLVSPEPPVLLSVEELCVLLSYDFWVFPVVSLPVAPVLDEPLPAEPEPPVASVPVVPEPPEVEPLPAEPLPP